MKALKEIDFSDCIGPHQEVSSCAPSCQPKCNKYPGAKCPPHIDKGCSIGEGCVCEDGYALVEDNKCVAIRSMECGGLHDPFRDVVVVEKFDDGKNSPTA